MTRSHESQKFPQVHRIVWRVRDGHGQFFARMDSTRFCGPTRRQDCCQRKLGQAGKSPRWNLGSRLDALLARAAFRALRLVVSLASLQANDTESFIDHMIVARAFRDVGFRSKAIEHLKLAADGVDGGYWDHRVQYELAEILFKDGALEKTLEVLRPVIQIAEEKLQTRAKLLAAQIRVELGQFDEARRGCESLMQSQLDDEQKRHTLELLGKSYQGLGQHYAAALCFGGLLPNSQNTVQP